MVDQFPIISGDPVVQDLYVQLRMAGESHGIAEVLATRSFPGVRTDSEFNKGRCNGNQFEHHPGLGDYYRGVAEAEGQSTTGKTYISQLARYPGDPEAWVSGRGDVERVCRDRGWGCSGAGVEIKTGDRKPADDVKIAPDIIEREVTEYIESHPGERLSREGVREKLLPILSGDTGQIDTLPAISDAEFNASVESTLQAIE